MKTKSKIAPGHNPSRLTLAQVGRGWRLLALQEIDARGESAAAPTHEIQLWSSLKEEWDTRKDTLGCAGSCRHWAYRTQRPKGYFLPASAKPKPAPAAKGGRGKRKTNEQLLRDELVACYDLFERCVKEQHSFVSMMLGLVSVRQSDIRNVLADTGGLLPLKGGRGK